MSFDERVREWLAMMSSQLAIMCSLMALCRQWYIDATPIIAGRFGR